MGEVRPDIRYARSGDVHVAYTVFGSGPDLVFAPGALSTIEWHFEDPRARRFMEQLGSFARVITFDKRGTGRSDRIHGVATLDERMDDIRAAMDAAGSERATIFGYSEGGAMGAMFAATFPDRTNGLIMWATPVRIYPDPADQGAPFVIHPDLVDLFLAAVDNAYETGDMPTINPDDNDDPAVRESQRRYLMLGAPPASAKDTFRVGLDYDLRPVFKTIRVPTLVMQRRDEQWVPIHHGRTAADLIPGARMIELPGCNHWPFYGDHEPIVAEIEEFVTGARRPTLGDRVLATVLFTDLVKSTETAAAIGDKRWREILQRHDTIVTQELSRFSGRLVKSTGDGVLATFDGPSRGVYCAQELHRRALDLGVEMRAGLHTGEVELIGDDIGGIAVHIASRVSSLAGSGDVLVSSTVKDLSAGSGIVFEERGSYALKGVPDEWRIYAVAPS